MPVDREENALGLDLEAIERYYGAKWVGDFPLPLGDGYRSHPVSIFWRPESIRSSQKPEYFAICGSRPSRMGGLPLFYVENANYIKEYFFNGLKQDDVIIYSHSKSHKSEFKETGAFIRGGFDECVWNPGSKDAKLVKLRVIDSEIKEVE